LFRHEFLLAASVRVKDVEIDEETEMKEPELYTIEIRVEFCVK